MGEPQGFAVVRVDEVPAAEGWLSEREREAARRQSVPRRHQEWRAGRWVARRAIANLRGRGAGDLEILAAADGAPEVWTGGKRMPVSVSISHRGGLAAALATWSGVDPGCDLEVVEPRSPRFPADWFTPRECAAVENARPAERDLLVTLIWSAKEAALKTLRYGLRVDTRQVEIAIGEGTFEARCEEIRIPGRWRRDGAIVTTTAALERKR